MKNLNICIAGLGTVGANLIDMILKNSKYINTKSDLNLNIIAISAKNKLKKRIFDIDKFKWLDNPIDLAEINECDVIIELIGNEKGVSYDLVKKALLNKKHVITANKALIAKHGTELFEIAEKNNILLCYEAAVAGGIPIIKTLKNSLFLDKVKKITGILNGTTNYILTEMEKNNFFKLSVSMFTAFKTPSTLPKELSFLHNLGSVTEKILLFFMKVSDINLIL